MSQDYNIRTNIKTYFLNYIKGFNICEVVIKKIDIINPELTKVRNNLQNIIATSQIYYIL